MKGVDVVAFEDGLASLPGADDDEGGYDRDFNDAFVAVSDDSLSRQEIRALVAKTGISRLVGTDDADRQIGTGGDDQLIALDGDDEIWARGGDDVVEASDGNDRAYGEAGADRIFGEEGRDHLFGGLGRDEIEGGEGRDRLYAGGNGAWLSGGADDDTLFGCTAAADVFSFDLVAFGDDRIVRFQNGSDRIEIADYLGVESFGDIEVQQRGSATLLSFAEGTVELACFESKLIDASDFHFL
jgi:Ca2+-binding RTX toxin-like protein